MDTEKSSALSPARNAGQDGQPESKRIPEYHLRGLGIVTISAEEILESYKGGGRYLVPSGTNPDQHYEVRVGTRPGRNRCECRGFASHKHCSHVVAASRVAKRSAVCDGCGERRWDRELVEITEEDESLTWFAGDRLCKACVVAHGGIS
ncbi:MAG: hypothetical protein M3R38_11645 [Actinomycetota bacterium]|nr:hypothetical protein [Actinomycetota bacterium]